MKKQAAFLLLMVATMYLSSCHKSAPEGKIINGQIALTFDDASIENWFNNLDLLDSLNIKATFYISTYHSFNAKKKAWLKEIERRGHEIAYHTSSHPDLPKKVIKEGMAQTEDKEIKSDLQLMRNDGYTITNFAYPFGSRTPQLDVCLLRTFKSVRGLSNQQNYYKSLVKESGDWKVLYGADIDNNSRLKEDGIISLMNDAQLHNDCLVLVAHQIENKSIDLQITHKRLQLIAKTAAEKHLQFITVNQIAQ